MEMLPLIIFFAAVPVLGTIIYSLAMLKGRARRRKRDHDIFESGVNPIGSATRRYHVGFYRLGIMASIFVLQLSIGLIWIIQSSELPFDTRAVWGLVGVATCWSMTYVYLRTLKKWKWEG